MGTLFRRLSLAVASIALALQTGTAAGMPCEVEAPPTAAHHGTHHDSTPGSSPRAPGGLHCVCVLGCQAPVVPGQSAAIVAIVPAPFRPVPQVPSAQHLVRLATPSHSLPFAHAPPGLA